MQERSIERMSVYRRIARALRDEGARHVFSHDLAHQARVSPSLVRRDLMGLEVVGNPNRGYPVEALLGALDAFLDAPEGDRAVLLGVGHLGRALLAYYPGRQTRLRIVAAFDADPMKAGRIIHGCRVLPMEDLEDVVRGEGIGLAILTVPGDAAQAVATSLVQAGVRGILNFAPARLHVPPGILVEEMDFTISFEKLAYLVRNTDGEEAR